MAPLCKGGCQPNRLTGGLLLWEQSLRPVCALGTSPYTGEAILKHPYAIFTARALRNYPSNASFYKKTGDGLAASGK